LLLKPNSRSRSLQISGIRVQYPAIKADFFCAHLGSATDQN
jgi:hypothetical protein